MMNKEEDIQKQVEELKSEIIFLINENGVVKEEYDAIKECYDQLEIEHKKFVCEHELYIKQYKSELQRLKNEMLSCIKEEPKPSLLNYSNNGGSMNQNGDYSVIVLSSDEETSTLNDENNNQINDSNSEDDDNLSGSDDDGIGQGDYSDMVIVADVDVQIKPSGIFVYVAQPLKNYELKCPCCSCICKDAQNVRMHFRKYHLCLKSRDKIQYKCHLCDTKFDAMLKLSEHIKTHKIEAIICDHCLILFKSTNALRVHKQHLRNDTINGKKRKRN